MTEHEKILFSILKSALWGAPVEIPEGFSQWSAILKLAKTQTLTGLVGDVMLTRSEIRESLPPSIVAKLQSIPLTYIGMHRQMNAALQVLVQTLRQNDIDPVLLKGQGLAKYYPIPELRQCGDIDIYVGEENYEKAYDALVQIVSSIDDKSNIWDLMHFHASVGSVIIEVHHRADKMYSRKKENIYKKYMIAGLSQGCSSIRCGDVDVMTPEDTYNALYIFVHIWRHFSASGVGLRQFCDWACFLHSNSDRLDLPYLRGMLQELGLLKPWQVFGCFLVKSLGLPKNEFPFYSSKYVGLAERVREYVMADGNFGVNVLFSKETGRGYLHNKWISFQYHILRFNRMFAIFPKHTMLRLYYVLRYGIIQVFKDLTK